MSLLSERAMSLTPRSAISFGQYSQVHSVQASPFPELQRNSVLKNGRMESSK